ncbi:NYN domain-containing protein [Bacillus sp. JJ1474]|uniref:NYN domain-containing protein n=1 Tax=Bacillus sp. JJ1474 TaxID=3122955 RepID=UPI0030002D41
MKNVAIYVDYDNLFKRLKELGCPPVYDVNFFVELKKKFEAVNYNVIKFCAFADFTDKELSIKEQTDIHSFGVEVFHCSINNKNSTDAEMTIRIMKDLYEINNIDVFVIVTNDRDFVPLIRAVKEKSKITYSLTTKTGINPVINVFSDYHQYLEDIFDLNNVHKVEEVKFEIDEITAELGEKAKMVSEKFYNSGAFKNLKTKSVWVSLSSYSRDLSKIGALQTTKSDVIKYFQIANILEFVELYEHENQLYIREGKKYQEIFHLEVAAGRKK